jgi:hypothetical protein
MLRCLIPLLLFLSAHTLLAAPVKEGTTIRSHGRVHASKAASPNTEPSLKPSSPVEKAQLTEDVRRRLYGSNRIDADGRKLTREEWEQKLKDDPTLETEAHTAHRQKASKHRQRSYLSAMMRKNPQKAAQYIQVAKEVGVPMEDLFPGGKDKSREAFKKRKAIRAQLVALRKEISLIGTPNQRSNRYRPSAISKAGELTSVEDQLLQEIGRFRVALRVDPYAPEILEIRDKTHMLMKKSLAKFNAIKLPYLSRYPVRYHAPSTESSSGSRSSTLVSTSPEEILKAKIHPPSLEELRLLDPEDKARYIESLFK